MVESARGEDRWITIGASENIIEASWFALWDSFELPLVRDRLAEAGMA
jgi:2-isopropylmalate synthase